MFEFEEMWNQFTLFTAPPIIDVVKLLFKISYCNWLKFSMILYWNWKYMDVGFLNFCKFISRLISQCAIRHILAMVSRTFLYDTFSYLPTLLSFFHFSKNNWINDIKYRIEPSNSLINKFFWLKICLLLFFTWKNKQKKSRRLTAVTMLVQD